jgi:hypothetical protein
MHRFRARGTTLRFLTAAVASGLLVLLSFATALASNGPGPWP